MSNLYNVLSPLQAHVASFAQIRRLPAHGGLSCEGDCSRPRENTDACVSMKQRMLSAAVGGVRRWPDEGWLAANQRQVRGSASRGSCPRSRPDRAGHTGPATTPFGPAVKYSPLVGAPGRSVRFACRHASAVLFGVELCKRRVQVNGRRGRCGGGCARGFFQ